MDLRRMYDYLMVKSAEPLTRGWSLVDSPFPITIISVAYMYFLFYAGPRYMKNRPPFQLRTFVLLYNLFQILANAWLVKEHISAGWLTEYTPLYTECIDAIDITEPITPNGFKLVTTVWWIFILKLVDYIETCVFVLRKKQNQVSILHVYHHVTVVLFIWIYLKYTLNPLGTIFTLINCFVHVIMYTYYFAAAWSKEVQKAVSPIKPYLTRLQMIQFCFLIVLLLKYIPNPECKILKKTQIAPWLFCVHIVILLYLFYDFYKKAYKKTSKTAKQKE